MLSLYSTLALATALLAPALTHYAQDPDPPDCPWACPNDTDFESGESGAAPGSVLFKITDGPTTDGDRRKETPCNANTTCTKCVSEFKLEWNSNGTGYTLTWRRSSTSSWKPVGDGTSQDYRLQETCGNDKLAEFLLENSAGQQVYYVGILLDCGCEV